MVARVKLSIDASGALCLLTATRSRGLALVMVRGGELQAIFWRIYFSGFRFVEGGAGLSWVEASERVGAGLALGWRHLACGQREQACGLRVPKFLFWRLLTRPQAS